MTKRFRFVLTSSVLSAGFVLMSFLEGQLRLFAIMLLAVVTALLFFWSLKEGLGKNATLVSLILPILFTLGVGVFWFLLPSNLYTKIPIVIFYALGIYVLCLTMNIYTVSASVRNIALLRAARGVGFVLTLVSGFLLYNSILSLRQSIYITFLPLFLVSLFIFLQGFWSIELEKKLSKELILMSLVSSLVISQIAVLMFFWPVTVAVGSLFLTSGVYLLLGLGQIKMEERLFPSTIKEYLTVGIVVLAGMFFSTHWG